MKVDSIVCIFRSDRFFSLITEWLIILICFGYPLQAMFVLLLQTESTPVNIFIRAVYLLLGIYLILSSFWQNIKRVHWTFFVFIVFWIGYGIRLIYDIEVRHLLYLGTKGNYVYAYAFGASLIPAAAVFLNAWRINFSRFFKNSFYILSISNVFITINILTTNPGGISEVFNSRAYFMMRLGEITVELINPISVSLYGALMALSSFWMLYNWDRKAIFSKWLIIILVSIILGLFNLIAGASKGPLFSFAIVFIFMTITKIWINKRDNDHVTNSCKESDRRSEQMKPVIRRLLPLLMFIAMAVFLIFISYEKLETTALGVRLTDYQNAEPTSSFSVRLIMWKNAWNQFVEHPFLGDSYLEPFLKSYPHNVILESFMATGILGGVLFLVFLFQPFYFYSRLKRSQKRKLFPVFMFFMVIFLLTMVSGGLFSAPDLWMITVTAIIIFDNAIKNPVLDVPINSN